jgi:hypothetical protein
MMMGDLTVGNTDLSSTDVQKNQAPSQPGPAPAQDNSPHGAQEGIQTVGNTGPAAAYGYQSMMSTFRGSEELSTLGRGGAKAADPRYLSFKGCPITDLDHVRKECRRTLDSDHVFEGKDNWQGPKALRNLSQFDRNPATKSDPIRCSASSVLASAVMHGPDSVDRIAASLQKKRGLDDKDKKSLEGIRSRLKSSDTTLGDLHMLQEILYRAEGGKDVNHRGTGLNPLQIDTMQHDVGAKLKVDQPDLLPDPSGKRLRIRMYRNEEGVMEGKYNPAGGSNLTYEDPDRTKKRVEGLNKGESFLLNIDNQKPGQKGYGTPCHTVLVGKDENGEYIYDPDPQRTHPCLFYKKENPQLFNRYLTDMGRKSDLPFDKGGPDNLQRLTGTTRPRMNQISGGTMSWE